TLNRLYFTQIRGVLFSLEVHIPSAVCITFLNPQLTKDYSTDIVGEDVEPKDVFLAFTVDQGGNVMNAYRALGVEVIKCNCHRVNSAVLWALGTAGSASKCKDIAMGDLMKKLAACVGVWSHSAVNNDKLEDIQRQL
ncbi:unnamed protein product, partial [Hapterophycus canaliculatus]